MFTNVKNKLESYSIEMLLGFIDSRIDDCDGEEVGNLYELSKAQLINDIIIPKYIEQTIEEDDSYEDDMKGIALLLEEELEDLFESVK